MNTPILTALHCQVAQLVQTRETHLTTSPSFTFTFSHLADAFIQSDLHMCDLQCIHILHLHRWHTAHQEQLGVQCLAQGCFDRESNGQPSDNNDFSPSCTTVAPYFICINYCRNLYQTVF